MDHKYPGIRVVSVEFCNEFQVNLKWARPSCIPTDLGDLGEIFSSQRRRRVVSRCPENQQQQRFVVSGERLGQTGRCWPLGAAWALAELSWQSPAGRLVLTGIQRLSHWALVPRCRGSMEWVVTQAGELCHYTRVKCEIKPWQHANTQWLGLLRVLWPSSVQM